MSDLTSTKPIANPSDQTEFSRSLLEALKAPETLGNIIFLNSWQQREEPSYTASPGANNPLNIEGSGDAGSHNGFAVYSTAEAGAQQTAAFLENNNYPAIVSALRNDTAYAEDGSGELAAALYRWSGSNSQAYTSVTLTEDNLTASSPDATNTFLPTGGTGGWKGLLGNGGNPTAGAGGQLPAGSDNAGGTGGTPSTSTSLSSGIMGDLEVIGLGLGATLGLALSVVHLTGANVSLPGPLGVSIGGGVPELWWALGSVSAMVLWAIFSKQDPICVLKHMTSSTPGACTGTLTGGNVIQTLLTLWAASKLGNLGNIVGTGGGSTGGEEPSGESDGGAAGEGDAATAASDLPEAL